MDAGESKRFREVADLIWDLAKDAKEKGFRELESALMQIVGALHAKSAGRNSSVDL